MVRWTLLIRVNFQVWSEEPGLLRLAKIVRSRRPRTRQDLCDCGGHYSGCSLRFPEDMENLEHQFEVYDASMRCRLQSPKASEPRWLKT
jgi:hypothetical protein